jgi:hypothetical protein
MNPDDLPLDSAALRLLAAVDGLPVRMGERDRLIRALDIVASTEWTRVVIGLSAERLESLRRPALLYTPNDLEHILGVARSLAALYGFEHAGVPHIAIALALTARVVRATQEQAVPVVSEAFGLGTLEDPSKALDLHLLRRERGAPVSSDGDGVRITPRGHLIQRVGQATHVAVRVVAAVVLAVLAVRGPWWLWPVAAASLCTTRDSRATTLEVVKEVARPVLTLRWPFTALLAVLTAALAQATPAWVLLGLLVVADVVQYGGEALVARHDRFNGDAYEGRTLAVRRLVSIPESFATRRRWIRLVITIVLAGVPAVAAAVLLAPDRAAPLYALAALLVAQRLPGFAALALVLGLVLGFALVPALVAVAAGGVALLVIAAVERPPVPGLPIPPLDRGGGRALARADRQARALLRRDRAAAAAAVLQTAAPDHPVRRQLLGWALLRSGRPGEAKNAVAALDADDPVRALVTGMAEIELDNPARASSVLGAVRVPESDARWARTFRAERGMSLLRAMARAEPDLTLVDRFAAAVPRTVTRHNLLPVIALVRLAAEAALPPRPELASKLAALGCFLVRWARDGRPIRFFGMLGRERVLDLELLRCAALTEGADLRAGTGGMDVTEILGSQTGAAHFLLRLDRPLEAAAVLGTLADGLTTPAQRLAALDSRIEAFAVLHWLRHRFTDLEERRHWWALAEATLEKAMDQAARGQDWVTLAELIESARLQLTPQDDTTTIGVAPFVRVRGISRLAAASWYQPDERPATFDLEDMADQTLGAGTWWWSTWLFGGRLFWALVPPSGAVTGGVLPCGDGSTLAATLAELRDALPVPYPGEVMGSDAFDDRIEQGALCGPPRAERALAAALGQLLPAELAARLRLAADEKPLPLAIAPAQNLVNMPWSLVGIPGAGRDLRLVERARIVLAPPAGLLAAVATRPASATLPLRLAVLNPGGVDASPGNELPGADALAETVPAGVTTVTAHDRITRDQLGSVLRGLPPGGSSAVFACHTVPGDGTPTDGGLLIRPGDRPEVLSTRALLDTPDRFPMPEQVLVLACESADLRHAVSGEWLVLGPALLWAGARRLVLTSFPIPEDDAVDRALIGCLVDETNLVDGLRAVQLDCLGRWRAGDAAAPPVSWSGHIAMGVFGHGTLRSVNVRQERHVHRSLVSTVDSAAERAAAAGRTTVTATDLIVELGSRGYEEGVSAGRRLLVRGAAVALTLRTTARARRSGRHRQVDLADDATAMLRAAAGIAGAARHRVLHDEHLFAAALATNTPAAAALRLLFGWDGRQPEVVKELISETQDNFQHVEQPQITYLTARAVDTVYATFDVPTPDPGDREPLLLTDA